MWSAEQFGRTGSKGPVDKATEEFILGLIHSDGCCVVANDRGVASIRYHFSNRSEDILALFTAALDTVVRVHRLDLPEGRDGTSGRVRRAEGPRGTVEWCPLHDVGDRRSSLW